MPTSPFLAPHRDDAFKAGRPKSGTAFYHMPGVAGVTMGTATLGNNFDLYGPMYTPTDIWVDQLAAEVTTLQAATTFRIGLYRADVSYQPVGAPLVDSGTLSAASVAVVTYTPGSPIRVPRGRFLTVFNTDASTAQWRTRLGNLAVAGGVDTTGLGAVPIRSFLYVTRTYAAFPTPGTAWTATTGTSSAGTTYPVWLRISTP